jgi:hypothetical protein
MRALWVTLPLWAMLTVASPARAEHHTDAAAAQTLFERGRSAAQQGELVQACAAFEESQRLDPGAGTLMNWAMCEARLNKLASAWQHFNEAAQLLQPGDDREAFVRAQLRKLEPRLPRLTLQLALATPQGARISRNGIPLNEASIGLAMPVDPGPVELLVTCPGRPTRRTLVELHEGEQLSLTLEPGLELAAPPAPSAASHPPHVSNLQRNVGLSLVAAGSLGLGLGLASGVLVTARKRTADQHCPAHQCDATGLRAADSGERWLMVNTLSWSLGAAALVSGTLLLVVAPDRKREASLQALPGGAAFVYAERY